MTTSQIASVFHARRIGRGKYMGHCPTHGRDTSPSLSIAEGKSGGTVLHCFAGCRTEDVLDAMGMTLKDLFPDSKVDKQAFRVAERLRREEEKKHKEERRRIRDKWDNARKWQECRDALGLLLTQRPESDKINRLFHYACDMSRDIPETGYCDCETILGIFPHREPLDGITRRDVGLEVAEVLHLPME